MTELEKSRARLLASRESTDTELQRAAIEFVRELLCAKLGYLHSDLDLDGLLTAISDEIG